MTALPDFSPEAVAAAERTVASLRDSASLSVTRHRHGAIHWRSWGEGPPLLLLHGNYGSWTHWLRNIPELSRHRRLLVPDLPGFGASDPPPAESRPADIALLLEAGLQELLGPSETLGIAAFSMGGRFAGVLAERLAERVGSLWLCGPGGLELPAPERPQLERPADGLPLDEQLALHARNLSRLMLSGMAAVDTLAAVLQLQNVRDTRYRPGFRRRDRSLHGVLPRVAAPLVAVWGEFDPYVGEHRDAYRAYVRSLPGPSAFRLVPAAAHWAIYENAAFCNALILEG